MRGGHDCRGRGRAHPGSAVLTVGSRFGLLDPKRTIQVRGWRRVGTAVVRWPAPIFATCAVALVGLLALPGYKVSYKDRDYLPKNVPSNVGMAAAERHFSQARMSPEILMIDSDHDMRNSADFLVLDKLAKGIFRVEELLASRASLGRRARRWRTRRYRSY